MKKKKQEIIQLHSGAHVVFGYIAEDDMEKLGLVKPYRVYREMMLSPKAFAALGRQQDNQAARKLIKPEQPKGKSFAVLFTLTDSKHNRSIPSSLETDRLLELYRL